MIIGGSKKEVIKNIETNINNNELNKKVEVGDPNLTEEEKTTINAKIEELESALKGTDIEAIKKAKDELVKASQNVAMRAYQKNQKNNGGTDGGAVNPDDIVDPE